MSNEVTTWTSENILNHPDILAPNHSRRPLTGDRLDELSDLGVVLRGRLREDPNMTLHDYQIFCARLNAPYKDSFQNFEFNGYIGDALRNGQFGEAAVHFWQKALVEEKAKEVGLNPPPYCSKQGIWSD